MIEYFEVENYKCFERLRLEGLGNVNLIVGENGVGKTALLEALYLRTNILSATSLLEVLRHRNETLKPAGLRAFKGLLHNPELGEFRLQPGDVRFGFSNSPQPNMMWSTAGIPLGQVSLGGDFEAALEELRQDNALAVNSQILWSEGISNSETDRIWDQIIVYGLLPLVSQALQLLVPEVEHVGLVKDSGGLRQPQVKIKGASLPVLIGRFGEGLERLFGIAIGMAASRGSQMMIDEIENGMHYKMHEKVWQFVFDVAEQLQVQVFATTHSGEMTRAFARVAAQHVATGKLVRLDKKYGHLRTVNYSEDEMLQAAEGGYEVR